MNLLELKGITKKFNEESVAVSSVDLQVKEGEFLALTGESGCGKTTLLRLIAGLEKPDSGSVSIDGTVVADSASGIPPQRRPVGMVFQDYALFPHMTVSKNIEFGIKKL